MKKKKATRKYVGFYYMSAIELVITIISGIIVLIGVAFLIWFIRTIRERLS